MRNKTLFVSALVLVALVLGACAPAASSGTQSSMRLLNVTGNGEVFLSPDIAYVNIGVHTEMETAADAVTANTAETQQVIDALKAAGVDANDIRTTNFSIWPNQQYSPDGQTVGTRYVVDNSVFVTVRDLANLGDLLDAAISAGANSINSIQFDVADKTEAMKQARAQAVEKAKERAQELAEAAGVSLGEVQSIGFSDASPMPYFDSFGRGGGGAAPAEASVPIQPGQLTLTVSVSMSYEIK